LQKALVGIELNFDKIGNVENLFKFPVAFPDNLIMKGLPHILFTSCLKVQGQSMLCPPIADAALTNRS
jgi:hypothetical protein